MKYDENLNENEDLYDDNRPPIRFKRKKAKANLIIFFKSIVLFIIVGMFGALSASILVEFKYNNLNKVLQERNNIIVDYSSLINNVKDSIVTIASDKNYLMENRYIEGNSTGIIIENNGRILTSYSKVKEMKDIYVKVPGGGTDPIKADLVVFNEDIDVAIIQIVYNGKLKPIRFASKEEKIVGERIVLISNSVGDSYIDNIIPGIITSINRSIEVNNTEYSLMEVNTPITEVNTGGLICNLSGELIGFASEKVNDAMNRKDMYYIADFTSLDEIIKSTNGIKDILGIIEGGFSENEELDDAIGLYVTRIKKDSSSYKAGLRPTDIILEIDGYNISDINEIYRILDEKNNNDILKCKVMRSGKIIELEIELGNIKK
ncbi:MAG: S1C family serine protease [Clostridium sp.]|uniref:S1C family serine protease n=1 Tax=Clostridium sp. TaxID=1506 RepID=UPI00290F96FE|nr:S1C family serine protease [Clostridium sp.]MDU5109815.1 S1C family serine protease [Clostridium sp.]